MSHPSSSGNFEKRRADRRQLYYYLKVVHEDTGEQAGYLGDISAEGLMIFSKLSMPLNRIFRLRITLDKEFGLGDQLTVEARSLWCEKDVNPDFFLIGLKFIALSPENLDIVHYLIRKYGFSE